MATDNRTERGVEHGRQQRRSTGGCREESPEPDASGPGGQNPAGDGARSARLRVFAAAPAPAVAASRPSRSGPAPEEARGGTAFDQTCRGRRIRGVRTPARGTTEDDRWDVPADGRPLHLMRHADGTWLSMVDCATRLRARRARHTVTWGTAMAYVCKDTATLTKTERNRFVRALLEFERHGEYDEFVQMYIAYFSSDGDRGLHTARMAPSFLPWHRRFLFDLERALRRVDSSVTVPYWD
jgi:hypothetical protein